MRRFMLGALTGAAVLLHAGSASAHEEISPRSFPTGAPVFLVLSVADEARSDLVKVALTAPQGLAFGTTTREPPGWTVARTDQLVTWTAGSVKPDHFEQWGFEIEGADQPGTLTYKVSLGYADGTSADASADVVATAANAPASGEGATGGRSPWRSNGAYAVAIAALALAVVALARSGRSRAAGSTTTPSPAPPGDGQDW